MSTTSYIANHSISFYCCFCLVIVVSLISLMTIASLVDTIPNPSHIELVHTNAIESIIQPVKESELPVSSQLGKSIHELNDYECVGWRQSSTCDPNGPEDVSKSQPCNATISFGASGYCEIQHKTSKQIQRVMEMHCDSLRYSVQFQCKDFKRILSYGPLATQYTHDATFTFEKCQTDFLADHISSLITNKVRNAAQTSITPVSFKRGIVMVVYEKLLVSVFASIRLLRSMGCHLPIELWYLAKETNVHHPIFQNLISEYHTFPREIKDTHVTRFYTKIYAVFYSAFDQVLLLDADNFAVRDPSYLFSTQEFLDKGAIFWPDFWNFRKSIFNIHPRSFVWTVFDLEAVDMFEQESGQVLIDRRRHLRAMNTMMYYAFHAKLFEEMRLVWGDKDLFRFAWMKTNSSFHMIAMPPGSAGLKRTDRNVFCGVTMVQHDPSNQILFLHRNQEKLTPTNLRIVWYDVQQYKINDPTLQINNDYDVRGANGGRYYPQFRRCFGKDIHYEKAFMVTPIAELPFSSIEYKLLEFVREAILITPTPIIKL